MTAVTDTWQEWLDALRAYADELDLWLPSADTPVPQPPAVPGHDGGLPGPVLAEAGAVLARLQRLTVTVTDHRDAVAEQLRTVAGPRRTGRPASAYETALGAALDIAG